MLLEAGRGSAWALIGERSIGADCSLKLEASTHPGVSVPLSVDHAPGRRVHEGSGGVVLTYLARQSACQWRLGARQSGLSERGYGAWTTGYLIPWSVRSLVAWPGLALVTTRDRARPAGSFSRGGRLIERETAELRIYDHPGGGGAVGAQTRERESVQTQPKGLD